jgi:oleandomycin transport system permease protein
VDGLTKSFGSSRGLMIGGPVARPLLASAAWIAGITVVSWALTIRSYRARA